MKVHIADTTLKVELEGKERFWALKSTLAVPLDDITNVEWFGGVIERSRLRGLRMPGASLPAVFHAGSFWRRDGWEFWYLYMNRPGYLVVTTSQKKYRVIRLSIDETAGKAVVAWFEKQGKVDTE